MLHDFLFDSSPLVLNLQGVSKTAIEKGLILTLTSSSKINNDVRTTSKSGKAFEVNIH